MDAFLIASAPENGKPSGVIFTVIVRFELK